MTWTEIFDAMLDSGRDFTTAVKTLAKLMEKCGAGDFESPAPEWAIEEAIG